MAAVRAMTLATGALVVWMSSNPSKTKYMYIWTGTRQQLAKLGLADIVASFSHIDFYVSLLFEIWESHWIKSLLLLLTSTACAVTAANSCVGSGPSAANLPLLLLLLHLSMLLSQLDLITAPHYTLVSLAYACN